MGKIGDLLVSIRADDAQFKKSLNDAQSAVKSTSSSMIKNIGLMAAAWKAVDVAMRGIEYNKMSQQAEIAFGVFLGSANKAKDMIGDLKKVAVETPLEFKDVRDAGKQLLAFGIDAKNLVPTIRMLTDVSAGLNIPMGDLSYLFGTIKTQGRAMTVDIMQFANRGIPIWEELAKVTGKSGAELRKMVEAGKIGFPEIEQAFSNMTSAGGKFYQMAAKQMDSFAGAQSNFNDSLDQYLGAFTKGAMDPIQNTLKSMTEYFGKSSADAESLGRSIGTIVSTLTGAGAGLAQLLSIPGKMLGEDLKRVEKDMKDWQAIADSFSAPAKAATTDKASQALKSVLDVSKLTTEEYKAQLSIVEKIQTEFDYQPKNAQILVDSIEQLSKKYGVIP